MLKWLWRFRYVSSEYGCIENVLNFPNAKSIVCTDHIRPGAFFTNNIFGEFFSKNNNVNYRILTFFAGRIDGILFRRQSGRPGGRLFRDDHVVNTYFILIFLLGYQRLEAYIRSTLEVHTHTHTHIRVPVRHTQINAPTHTQTYDTHTYTRVTRRFLRYSNRVRATPRLIDYYQFSITATTAVAVALSERSRRPPVVAQL